MVLCYEMMMVWGISEIEASLSTSWHDVQEISTGEMRMRSASSS